MKCFTCVVGGLVMSLLAATASAQGRGAAAAASEIYHVSFFKAAPGQAAALSTQLQAQDPKAPMQGHYIVLRHQEGDDWDFCTIEHLGAKATVEILPAPPATNPPVMAWHNDAFVSGPSWTDAQRALGAAGGVYIVSTHRAVPGHRDQLVALLNQVDPAPKVQIGHVLFTHLEGQTWQHLSVDRYASWQDLATDRAASTPAGWADTRQHSASHADTIADRVK